MTVTVRLASLEDAPALLAMGEKFHAASGEKVAFCARSAGTTLQHLLRMGFVLLAESDGLAVGMIGIAITPLFFNHKVTFAQELVWWVDQDQRGSGAAMALIREAETEARRRGASRLHMLRLAGSPTHVARIYERLGYSAGESSHVKEL